MDTGALCTTLLREHIFSPWQGFPYTGTLSSQQYLFSEDVLL